ncbi:MAG TPA: hypothetical protein VLT90_02415 [Terriglobales bacterium]|nr:hypothetical protein [Terriglobales bacterium]
MNHEGPITARFTIRFVLLVLTLLVACNQSKRIAAPALPAPGAERVFVIFEGPWALVADPKDDSMVLALAPKTKNHRDLTVGASRSSGLASGMYELSVPDHETPATVPLDASFAQTKIEAKSLQRALDGQTGRYVIRLPKPEAYAAAQRIRSRIGATYPPDASTEQNYVTSVSLRYTVSSLGGFSLAGIPDNGNFNQLPLLVDTPMIQFRIEPIEADDPLDACNTSSRLGFAELNQYLSLKLYVDFPDDPASCHDQDPQKIRAAGAHPGEKLAARTIPAVFDLGAGATTPPSSVAGDSSARLVAMRTLAVDVPSVGAAAYFLHAPGIDCKAPMLFLTMTP